MAEQEWVTSHGSPVLLTTDTRHLSPRFETPFRVRGGWWIYAAAWLPFLTVYLAAFVASGVPFGPAIRNAVASLLPDALLGVALIRTPARLPWPEAGAGVHADKGRFFAAHAALVVGFVAASTGVWIALVTADSLAFHGTLHANPIELRTLPWRVLIDLLIYGMLTGFGYAWQNAAAGREQAARAARAEALRARAQLEAMRSQLNPHFILNTFHALVGLVRRDPPVAEEALERLGDLLRDSLRIQRESLDEVTLRDEWSFVQSYLDLERLRLGGRLRASFDAPASALDCIAPSFAVQTLVENAIRHSIAPRAEGGRLSVRAPLADGRLRIVVEDDGPGPSGETPASGPGIGLRLLQERLAALYGGRASLELRVGAGCVSAILDLPERRVSGEP